MARIVSVLFYVLIQGDINYQRTTAGNMTVRLRLKFSFNSQSCHLNSFAKSFWVAQCSQSDFGTSCIYLSKQKEDLIYSWWTNCTGHTQCYAQLKGYLIKFSDLFQHELLFMINELVWLRELPDPLIDAKKLQDIRGLSRTIVYNTVVMLVLLAWLLYSWCK